MSKNQKIKRVTENGTRYYLSPNSGAKLPSVTTVLSKFEDKRWLRTWRENNPESAAITHRASSLGTRIHSCNEELLLKGSVDFSRYETDPKVSEEQLSEIKARHYAYLPFLSFVEPISIEENVIYERFNGIDWSGFAGAIDLVCYIKNPSFLKQVETVQGAKVYTDIFEPNQGITAVVDYKNYKSIKKPGDCIKAFCQLSAYAAAKNETLAPENKIKHAFLLCTSCSEKLKKTNLYIYYLDFNLLNKYFSWFDLFVKGWYGLVDPKTIKWWDFKSEVTGVYKADEDPETGKAIWGHREINYLGKKLEIVMD